VTEKGLVSFAGAWVALAAQREEVEQ